MSRVYHFIISLSLPLQFSHCGFIGSNQDVLLDFAIPTSVAAESAAAAEAGPVLEVDLDPDNHTEDTVRKDPALVAPAADPAVAVLAHAVGGPALARSTAAPAAAREEDRRSLLPIDSGSAGPPPPVAGGSS